jgi:hypothetical protein
MGPNARRVAGAAKQSAIVALLDPERIGEVIRQERSAPARFIEIINNEMLYW